MGSVPFCVSQTLSRVFHFRRPFLFWNAVLSRRSRRLLPLAVALSLIFQLLPLGLPVPSRAVNQLLDTATSVGHRLSILPAWMDPGAATVTEVLAPADQLVAGLASGVAYAPAVTTTLQFAKVCEPNPVNQGGLITYSLYITNSTLYTATIFISDTFPAGTSYVGPAESISGGADWQSMSYAEDSYILIFTTDRLPPPFPSGNGLPPGGVAVQRFQVRVSEPFTDGAVITNTAVLTANIDTEITAWCTTTVSAPTLVIAKTPSSSVVEAGDPLTFTLYVTNTGHLTATLPFTIADRIPDNTSYVTSSPPSTYSPPTITWVLTDDLGIGQSVTTTFVVSVATPFAHGATITNTTYRAWSSEVITVAEGDPIAVTVLSHPTLTLTKTAGPDPVQAGGLLTYTLTLTNQSSATGSAQNIVVTDTVPLSTTYDSCSGAPCVENGGIITWTLPAGDSLSVGESTQLTFTVLAYSPLLSGTLVTNESYGVTATYALAPTAGDPLTTTINSNSHLTVTKSVAPSSVLPGNPVTYTIIITNDGNETATGVTITDTLPVSFTFGNMVQGPDPTVTDNVLTWTNRIVTGTVFPPLWMSPGPLTLIFTATAGSDIPEGTIHTNQVTVTYGLDEITTGPTAPVTVTPPQLTLIKVGHPDVVSAGEALTYTITYSNTSGTLATSVIITDLLPAHVAFVTTIGDFSSYTPTTPLAGQVMTYTVGNLPGNSGLRVITLIVTVDTPLTNSTVLTNEAWLSAAEPSADSTGPVTTTVQSAPDIVLDKHASASTVSPGDTLTYTLQTINNGNANANGVVITDVLPNHTYFVTATGGTFEPTNPSAGDVMTWTLGSLLGEGWQTLTATLVVTIGTPLTNGLQIPNTAWITSAEGVGDADTVTVTVSSAPSLMLNKSDAPDPVDAGATLLYTINVTNLVTAEAPATGVVVTDVVPANTTFLAATQNGFSGPAGGVITWTLSHLAPGNSTAVTFTVQVDADLANDSELINTAWVTSVQGVGAFDTETTTVLAPDMTVSKSATPAIVRAGKSITYVIVFTNSGGVAASNVRITDTLPVSASLVVSQTTAASFVAGSTHAWFSPTVAPGSVGVITITVQVTTTPGWINPHGGTPILNSVEVRAASDGNPANNQASTSTTVCAGLPHTLTLTAAPTSTTVDSSATISVMATDQWDNPVMDQDAVTITLASSLSGSQIAPPLVTLSGGQATATITSTATGVALVTGMVGANPAVTGTTQVTFTAGQSTFITLTIVPTTTGVGTSAQMTATVVDAYGNPVPSQVITFTTADSLGTGGIAPYTDTTDASGVATSVITSTASGVKWVVARASASVIDTAPVTFTAGTLDHFAIGPVNSPQTAGIGFALLITAQDQYNNTVLGFTNQVTITDSSSTIAPPVSNSFAGGVRSETVTITLAQDNVIVTVTNTATGIETGSSNAFDVIANVPAIVSLQADPVDIPLGGTALLTATVTDAWGNLVADGNQVDFDAEFGWLNPLTDTTTGGIVTSQLTADCTERIGVLITATASAAFTTTTVNFISPGAPVSLTVVAAPSSIPVDTGTAIVSVTVTDCGDNGVPGETVNLLTSQGSLLPASGTTGSSGVATATLSAGTVAGTAVITATSDGLSATTTVVIEPGLPATVTVMANPGSIPANGTSTSTITVIVTDQYGNAVADGTGVTLDYSPTALGILSPSSIATTNGSESATFTADTVTGTVTITATAGSAVGTTLLTLTEGTFYVYLPLVARNYTPPPAYDLTVEDVTWTPSPPTAGEPYHVQVVLRNDGTMTVTNDFWVDLYLRPSATPGINQTWNMLSLAGYGKAWLVHDDIGPGQTLTLHTSDPDDPDNPGDRYSYWPPPLFDTSHNPFYVLVDSWGESYGLVGEGTAEDNNLWGPANTSGLSGQGTEEMNHQPSPTAPPSGPRLPFSLEGGWGPRNAWWG